MRSRRRLRIRRVATCGLLLIPTLARAQQPSHAHPLGHVDFRVSCTEPVRAPFDRAVALLHHMTYPQARAAFLAVAATDTMCAMAHWGVAMTLFQPLWPTRPTPEELQRGWQSVERALALGPRTDRERLLVDAAAAFFREPTGADYWLRIRRWEAAMAKAYAALPRDDEIGAFRALALLATMPADSITRANADRAAEILVRIHEHDPEHPGAMHYLVHANDVPGRARALIDVTRRYDAAAPRNPHALHMPTHIYTRLGDWEGVIRGNRAAADAALEHPAGERGELVWDEFPHAIEYLVYAYLQQGADDSAAAQLRRLEATPSLQPTFKTAFHLASTRARFALERGDWTGAAAIVPREPATLAWDRFAWPEAIAHYARGVGAARSKEPATARAAAERLAVLRARTDSAGERLFARNIRVLELELRSWIASSDGKASEAIALMREAAEVETSTPKHAVTPGPTIPAYEQLGELLLSGGQAAPALAAFEQSLDLHPGRFNSILGAARAATALGRDSTAAAHYESLLQTARGGGRAAALAEARAYLARRQARRDGGRRR